MLTKVKRLFGHDIFQRGCYSMALVTWSILNLSGNNFQSLQHNSSVGLSYFWLYLIPALLLTVQIVRNNLILWIIIAGSFLAYTIYAILVTLKEMLDRSSDVVKPFNPDLFSTLLVLFIFGLLVLLNGALWLLKPKRVI